MIGILHNRYKAIMNNTAAMQIPAILLNKQTKTAPANNKQNNTIVIVVAVLPCIKNFLSCNKSTLPELKLKTFITARVF